MNRNSGIRLRRSNVASSKATASFVSLLARQNRLKPLLRSLKLAVALLRVLWLQGMGKMATPHILKA